jgi:hypothetical protein
VAQPTTTTATAAPPRLVLASRGRQLDPLGGRLVVEPRDDVLLRPLSITADQTSSESTTSRHSAPGSNKTGMDDGHTAGAQHTRLSAPLQSETRTTSLSHVHRQSKAALPSVLVAVPKKKNNSDNKPVMIPKRGGESPILIASPGSTRQQQLAQAGGLSDSRMGRLEENRGGLIGGR